MAYQGIPAGPLAAYLNVRNANQEAGMGELQQVGAVQGLLAKMQAQQQEQRFQSELQALGPNPTPEQIAPLAMRYRKPELAVSMLQAAEQRKSRELMGQEVRQSREETARLGRESREDIASRERLMRRDFAGQMERYRRDALAAQETRVTPVTIQDPNDPNSTIIIDGRTNKVLGKGPKLTEVGKANIKRQIASEGIGDAIQQARNLLTGVAGQELPTQSGIGVGVDYAASLFGITPAGAAAADKLRVVGGSLVQKVPRFEGPQSDKDTAFYKEVAGRVGDASIPIARRLAALDEVENIWGQFEQGKKRDFFQFPGARSIETLGAKEGDRQNSRSGKPMIFRNGRWEYE